MRPLTESETKTLFSKLANYIGSGLVHLVDNPDDVSALRPSTQLTFACTRALS